MANETNTQGRVHCEKQNVIKCCRVPTQVLLCLNITYQTRNASLSYYSRIKVAFWLHLMHLPKSTMCFSIRHRGAATNRPYVMSCDENGLQIQ